MFGFEILAFAVWLLAISLTVVGTIKTLKHLKKTPPHLDAPFGLYPISVLKPVKGVDFNLRENLETFFKIDYPKFELLFSLASAHDPALNVVEELIAEYPQVDAKVYIGDVKVGHNPKVNNMVKTYRDSKYDLVLISDSNVRVDKNYLKRMMAHMDNGVGVLTAIVAGRDFKLWGGLLEAMYLNTFYARWMVLAPLFGKPCVVGKSMLLRKSVANRFGGIEVMGRYLAEDYMTGEAMRFLGLRVEVMVDPIIQPIGRYTFDSFWARHLRWGRIRKNHAFLPFLLEPWVTSVVSGLLGAYSIGLKLGLDPSIFFMIHWGLWMALDMSIFRRLNDKNGVKYLARHIIGWAIRELLAVPLWLHVLSGNKILWRGNYLKLRRGGLLEL